MGLIDDLVLDIRKSFFARNFTVGEFDNETVKKAIGDALLEYSRFRPRKNRRDHVDLIEGEYYIDLPANFMGASTDYLSYIITGNLATSSYSSGTGAYRGKTFLSVFDSQLGATNDPPPSFYYGSLINTPDGLYSASSSVGSLSATLTTGDTGGMQLALNTAITADATRTLVYDAFHLIDATKNTVPGIHRDIIVSLALGNLLITLATDLLSKPNSIKNYNVANQYMELSKQYKKALNRIASFGFVG